MKGFLKAGLFLFLTSLAYANTLPQTQIIDGGPLTAQHLVKTYHQPTYTLDAIYPLFTGNKLTPAQTQFNAVIEDTLDTERSEFLKILNDITNTTSSSPDMDIRYTTELLTPQELPIMSIRFTVSTMIPGNAYPNLVRRTVTFDFAKGRGIGLAELFKENSDFIPVLNHYCEKKLSVLLNQSPKQIEESGALNYAQWNITVEGLLISFDDFPHVFGPVEVLIPYAELQSVLKPNGITNGLSEGD